ncbi:6-phosphofructokinase [Mycoplasmatota bacterium]|nr:6-phosphofructokinase [Mycoplasmatota bacterium]
MKKLIGNLMYGQSGGPTSVINASAYGVIKKARENQDIIENIYVMKHGIQGALNEEFFLIDEDYNENIELLKHTPGSAFGSVRYKLKSEEQDDSDYKKLLEVFKKYNIRYFLYNGGNDSMDTCSKIASFMKNQSYDIHIIGVPKTIDNDLPYTDHTPGFGSAAKFISNIMAEICYDMSAYPVGKVTIVEIMGRHAGWLTASSALASINGFGPDLIYLPERPFSIERFKADVKKVYDEKNHCLVAVSEGIVNELGEFVFASKEKDNFGHSQLGGVAAKLSQLIADELKISTRSVELSSSQRSASHFQSLTDVEEAISVGEKAVELAMNGHSDVMVGIHRLSNDPYQVEYEYFNLAKCANEEKKMDDDMINEEGNGVTEKFIQYALPLIQGENQPKYHLGIQKFAKIK